MITLLTDFGTADYFVAAMKGVIFALHSQAQIVDLTHEIPAQNIAFGAFTLGACYENFPARTIHVAIVDPGVGSARRPIIVQADNYFLVGPDNGIFSYVYTRAKNVRVFHAQQSEFFRARVSPTFHGRDVFAPLAAWLDKGLAPENFGTAIEDFVCFALPRPVHTNEIIIGEIIQIDHFGNCITNLTAQDFAPEKITATTTWEIANQVIAQSGTHFAQATEKEKLLAYLGSAGYWEIALWQDSAAQKLGLRCGEKIVLYKK